MFKKKTVFIVGAGASKEFGLPTGDELKKQISNKIDIRYSNGYSLSNGDPQIAEAVKEKVRQDGGRDPNPYYAAGRQIAAALPQAISIDNFLHTHQSDDRIRLMGKMGILQSILEAERSSPIFCRTNRNERIQFGSLTDTWHTTFCKMATEGVDLDAVDGIFENVGFITFNYDRCIEHYLSQALVNYFGIQDSRSQEIVSATDIIHPYGQVGHLPWQNKSSSVDFGAELRQSSIVELSDQIRTFTERVEDEAVMSRMHRLLANAEVVVFLGFSYGDMNMELLRTRKDTPTRVFGTSLGMSEPNAAVSQRDIRVAVDGAAHMADIHLASLTCNELLHAYWKPIQR